LQFELAAQEQRFLSPEVASATAKNVSFEPTAQVLKHAVGSAEELSEIQAMLARYHGCALELMRMLLPQYANTLQSGRTSFRPAEIAGRRLSAKKDDTRLHVDAFPSTPTGGNRILRVFTNVNPNGHGREWRLGAPFEDVAAAFAGRVARYSATSAILMKAVRATKSYRTAYDHLMLNMHDMMKADETYQREAQQNDFSFPPGSTWIAYTDKVSHAAIRGQHLFEQTFYLPVAAMADPAKAPLRILERIAGHTLI
jgi:hypothetical protein